MCPSEFPENCKSDESRYRQQVKTSFAGKVLRPLAWRGKEVIFNPQPVTFNANGWCEVEMSGLVTEHTIKAI